MLKQIGVSTNDICQVWNSFAKAAITGTFHRASPHSITKKGSKIEIVHSARIPQNTVKCKAVIVQSTETVIRGAP